MTTLHTADVTIIGSGPSGLFAIFECGMLGLSCQVVDALDHLGGQCRALYPEKPIYDIPAHPCITGGDLIDRLLEQAAPFHPTYHLNNRIEQLTQRDDGTFVLGTSMGLTLESKAVIIAAGVGAFGPNRPPLDNIRSFEGRSVFYAVQRRADFSGKRIVIAGGGDSAVDWALSLADVASSIHLVHRRAKFKAAPESLDRLDALVRQGHIEMVVPYQLSGLEGQDGLLHAVRVKNLEGIEKTINADVLLPFFGLSMDLGPLLSWGLHLDKSHIAIDPLTSATNIGGIYAIGDVATYPHKKKLILTGFAEAANAAYAVRAHLHPGESFHFEYSTTQGVPKASA